MATTNKVLNQPTTGSTGWAAPLNDNASILDRALGAFTTIPSTSGTTVLNSSQFQNMCIKSTTSAFTANVVYQIPAGVGGQWVIQNQSATSPYSLTVSNATGGTTVDVPNGTARSVYSDGTNIIYADTPSFGVFTDVNIADTLTLDGGMMNGVASQAVAQAGTDNNKIMTPLRTQQAIEAQTKEIGVGQSWQVMPYNFSQTYTNSTGKPIQVSIYAYAGNTTVDLRLYISGIMVQRFYGNPDNSDIAFTLSGIVPNGASYYATQSGFYTHQWAELR